jgi:CRISPR/Cas system CSM-associated protein Csm5 (group 7 of RAMP superfamily)
MLSGVRALSKDEYRTIRALFLSIKYKPTNINGDNSVNSKTIKLVTDYLSALKNDLFRIGCKTGEGYSHRFKAEHELIQELEVAIDSFFQNKNNEEFIQSCKDALKKAKPVLDTHLGWGGFFNSPTTSGDTLDAFLERLETLSPGPSPNPSP